jgi:hypothetical protein
MLMAELEIGPLTDRLSDDEIAELAKQMEKLGAGQLPRIDASQATMIDDDVDDDVLGEFLDSLDAHDCAAEIYLPVEFEGVVEVAGLRVGSAQTLLDVLEEVKDELDIAAAEEEEEDEDDDEDDDHASEAALRAVYKVFVDGAQACIDRKLPLHVKS